jgi:pimeloyl-ACP methyl ester carboxylesterase
MTKTQFITIHGHEVAYQTAGEGPVIVLLHGIAGSSATWSGVIDRLARTHRVVAPDLLGHGESAKPRGDYSLGAYASGVRDLMVALGLERATVVGHSLGGGVAMQVAYQFPDRVERLVLVGAGGLGKDVSLILRALALPGAEYVLPVLLTKPLRNGVGWVVDLADKLHLRPDPVMAEMWESWGRLTDARAQRAFVHTVRSVVDVQGQRVSARDRLYLAQEMPSLIVWGDKDGIIPVEHAHETHELMPGSRLEIFEGGGHFVPLQFPERFAAVIEDFVATTEPARIDENHMQALLTGAGA